MALTQSEAICFLAVEMSNADGEMKDPEKKIWLSMFCHKNISNLRIGKTCHT